MRSVLILLLMATAGSTLSLTQQVDPRTGAICRTRPASLNGVPEKAAAGDPEAEYLLGISLLSPKPNEEEFASAMPWFRRSAEQGYAPAEYMYGGMFREGRWRNPQQLVYWWTKAAGQEEVDAQLWLGDSYEQGRHGVKRDYAQAIHWLSMAAKQGQPDAQVTLGQMYEDGEGVPQDYRLAASWYRKAADHVVDLGGAGLGASSLAELYRHDHATPKDYVSVYVWYAMTGNIEMLRDVAKKMTPEQVAEAQRRVMQWYHPRPACPSPQ